jgi:hypothetical protein
MISKKQIEKFVINLPKTNRELIINYIKGKIPDTLEPIVVQDDCKLSSSQAYAFQQICNQIKDGDLLSVTIDAVAQINEQTNDEVSRLIMSGNFLHRHANQTHTQIYEMIGRSKSTIMIIGYWVHDMQEFFKELDKLSKNIRITFILNHEQIEKHASQIKKNWNGTFRPEIYCLNRKKYSKNILNKLHSKVIVIDNTEILITSANMTKTAMEKNIETGVWTKDKKIINACQDIFSKFIKDGVFVPVEETY